jgi:DNA-binding transcriptional LysR family regulator
MRPLEKLDHGVDQDSDRRAERDLDHRSGRDLDCRSGRDLESRSGRGADRLADLGMDRLVSFVCVAEELHFGRAAAQLHLSQPALSQQIAKLEGKLGATLFLRGAGKVRLTLAGRLMLRACRQVLATMDRTVGTIRADLPVLGLALAFENERHRAYATALAAEIGRLLGTVVTPAQAAGATLTTLIVNGQACAGVTDIPYALTGSHDVLVEVVGSPARVSLVWPRWASRAESAQLVQAGHAVWRDLAATTGHGATGPGTADHGATGHGAARHGAGELR